MTVIFSLSGHLSSIRAFDKTSMKEENSFLLVSVGGRAQMMLWKIKNDLSKFSCFLICLLVSSSCNKLL